MYCIYLMYNWINGKIYVGKTSDFDRRFKDHLKIARGGKTKYPNSYSYIHSALNKYGFGNFIIKAVDSEIADETFAFQKEIEWIATLRENGFLLYNLTKGGDGASGHTMSEDGRKRLALSKKGLTPWNKGKSTPEDTRIKQSLSTKKRFSKAQHPLKGKVSHFKGKKRPEGFGEKISKSKKGVPRTKSAILATSKLTEEQVKEIRNLINQGKSNKDIAKLFNVHRDTISRIKNSKTWKG